MQKERTRKGEEIEDMKAKTALREEIDFDFEGAEADLAELEGEIALADRQLVRLEALRADLEGREKVEGYESKVREVFAELAELGDMLQEVYERYEKINISSPTGYRPTNEFYSAVRSGIMHLGSLNLGAWLRNYHEGPLYFFVQKVREEEAE